MLTSMIPVNRNTVLALSACLGVLTGGIPRGIAAEVPPSLDPSISINPANPDILMDPGSIPPDPTPWFAQTLTDPATEAAPAGLTVRPGNEAITPFLAITMRQELENLVGRFESALLLANSWDESANLTAAGSASIVTASLETKGLNDKSANHPVLDAAQQLLDDWPTLLDQGNYTAARQRWLTVRQELWNQFPVDRPFGQAEIRAMWLDRGTIVRAGSPQGLERIFDRLAAAGINTVFVETVNAGYTIYPSQVAPQQNPLTRHWDPLAAAVTLGKARGMEVHAWVWTFAAGNQQHNALLNLPASYPGPVLNAHPHWANYDNRGNIIPPGQTKPFLDPANPEVRRYLMRLLSEIASRYDVDGIQLDYIRYPFQDPGADRTYGYGLAARQQFRRLTGVDPITLSPRPQPQASAAEQQQLRQLWAQWDAFRIQQVNSFVAEASQMLHRQDPDLTVSAAVFALPTHERLQKLQQDWETWATQGDVDWIVLMSYALDTNRFEELIRPWVLESNFGSTLIIPGIRLLDLHEMAAFDQMQALRDLPTSGYALFAVDNLERGIQAILNSTQGSFEGLRSQPLPQQAPFTAAVARYQALQREWNWLLANNQLSMEERRLNRWVAEANSLADYLEALAESPSRRELAQVRSRIERLRSTLNAGTTVRTTSSAYRLRTWQHRLTTIENLLAYGEDREL
jgi:uncharacterized lipoprotein YddW (UPF0748 family)